MLFVVNWLAHLNILNYDHLSCTFLLFFSFFPKDKDRTRNLAEKSDKKAFEEARKRLHMEEKDKKALIPDLRERARKDYVKKRKTEKVDSLREELHEDERMFDERSLTEKEKLERQYKKKVLFPYIDIKLFLLL